jgi:hypothetical protein
MKKTDNSDIPAVSPSNYLCCISPFLSFIPKIIIIIPVIPKLFFREILLIFFPGQNSAYGKRGFLIKIFLLYGTRFPRERFPIFMNLFIIGLEER